MAKRSFGRVLDGIVSAVLASAVGAVGVGAYGCGGTTGVAGGDGGAPTDGGPTVDAVFADDSTFTCVSPLADVLSNLKPATPVDYVELRAQTFDNPSYTKLPGEQDGGVDAGPPATVLKTVSQNGQACATATKRDACLALVAAAKVPALSGGWQPHLGGGNQATPPTLDTFFLVYTRGDDVGVVHSTAELATFLGSVDTLEEARFLLLTQGYTLTCGDQPKTGWKRNPLDGSWDLIINGDTCAGIKRYRYRIGVDGTVTRIGIDSFDTGVACGRRPEGLVHGEAGGGVAIGLGAYFAEVAHLEAASVIAFRRLELELQRLGAPADLSARAGRARTDEIRHARETAALARRFGGELRALDVAPMIERDLLAIAVENAAEGCVRETYGALVASYQARTASDPEVRRVLARIARDEARHAELSHDVARWLDTQLDEGSRAHVAAERVRAIATLRAAIEQAPASDVIDRAGMPSVAAAHALLDGLEHTVLAA